MIKFFRHIRKSLLEQNKMGKYFKYAIGEILLVVVGILIALQINNWNENRKENIQEKAYLTDLRDELRIDVQTLNLMINKNKEKLSNINAILDIITSKEKLTSKNRKLFLDMLSTLFVENYFIPEKGTINQIESSSSGDIIKNKKLRDLIFRYYSVRERHEKNMEQSLQLYQHNYITPKLMSLGIDPLISKAFFGKEHNLPAINASEIKNNRDYINAIGLKFGVTKNQNESYNLSKEKAEELLVMINKELEK